MYNSTDELWAIMDGNGNILFTDGGSSTPPKLMVYKTESKAKRCLRWIPSKVGDQSTCKIKMVYKKEE